MVIVIPVTIQGVSIASRAGMLGQRKVAAMRIAQSVLNELVVTGQVQEGEAAGTVNQDGIEYPWTMESEPWSEDAMTVATVKVVFRVQGHDYDISVSTLYDPAAGVPAALTETP